MTEYEIQHHRDDSLFFIVLQDDERAVLNYRLSEPASAVGQIDIYSTFVPADYRGKGLAAMLVNHAFEWAEKQGLQIKTSCWYAAKLDERRSSS